MQAFADGFCDLGNNNAECGYDGGDCCESTCVSSDQYTCGASDLFGFKLCFDPLSGGNANNCKDDPNGFVAASGYSCPDVIAHVGCDFDYQTVDAHYPVGSLVSLFCPESCGGCSAGSDDDTGTPAPTPALQQDSICRPEWSKDGLCDPENNVVECAYDGGDCCESTCVSSDKYSCGLEGPYDCVDPSATGTSSEQQLVHAHSAGQGSKASTAALSAKTPPSGNKAAKAQGAAGSATSAMATVVTALLATKPQAKSSQPARGSSALRTVSSTTLQARTGSATSQLMEQPGVQGQERRSMVVCMGGLLLAVVGLVSAAVAARRVGGRGGGGGGGYTRIA